MDEEALHAIINALAAIKDRLERDLDEREKIVLVVNSAIARLTALENRVGEIEKTLATRNGGG